MNILILNTFGSKRDEDTFYASDVMEAMNALGNVDVLKYERTEEGYEELKRRIVGVDVLFTGWGVPKLGADFYEAAKDLKIIAHTGGTVADMVDENFINRGDIRILSGNDYYAESVASATICYILLALRKLYRTLKITEEKGWFHIDYNRGLRKRTVGLVSFGMISKHVARMLQPFDCKVKVWSSHAISEEEKAKYNIEQCSLEELFSTSDVVSVHSGLSEKTYHLVDGRLMGMMKQDALIVNTARGAVIDEAALEPLCQAGKISAILDVFEVEPLPMDSKLRGLDNVIIVPHDGGPTIDVHHLVTLGLIDDVRKFFNGENELVNEISVEYAKNMTSNKVVSMAHHARKANTQ